MADDRWAHLPADAAPSEALTTGDLDHALVLLVVTVEGPVWLSHAVEAEQAAAALRAAADVIDPR